MKRKHLSYTREVSGSYLDHDTDYSDRLFSVLSQFFQENSGTTLPSMSFAIYCLLIILPFDDVWTELLTAPLKKP
jgi:hypothetical protein